jgi:thiol:disulfide interchange protein DsbD
MRFNGYIICCLALYPLLSLGAASSAKDGAVTVELIAEPAHIQPGTPFWVAIRLTMDSGWHTYWRNPGDSGGPTEIEWMLPDGFEAGPIQWPIPQRIDTPPLTSYGYENEAWLLTRITPPPFLQPDNAPVRIHAIVEWLMCHDVCIPGSREVGISVPTGDTEPAPDTKWAEAFAVARARLPVTASEWHVSAEATDVIVELHVTPPDDLAGTITSPLFFAYDPELIDHAFTQRWIAEHTPYRLLMKRSDYADDLPDKVEGVLVYDGGRRAVEVIAAWATNR